MFNIKKFISSRSGVIIMSIILGLGLSSLFRMSCNSRSCIVYGAPDFSEKKIIKYNNKCYKPEEKMETCNPNKKTIEV
jgi:hypothetical protein